MTAIDRLYQILHQQKKKPADLCRYVGITGSTLANWKDRNSEPPSRYLVAICDFLNISVDYLLTGNTKNLPDENSRMQLSSEAVSIAKLYDSLDEKSKAKAEGFLAALADQDKS